MTSSCAAIWKHAVSRGVHDRVARAHVLLAQLLENFRAAGRLIADRFASDGALKCVHQILRKAVLVDRKGLVQPDAGHLPMARGGVLPRRVRGALAEATSWRLRPAPGARAARYSQAPVARDSASPAAETARCARACFAPRRRTHPRPATRQSPRYRARSRPLAKIPNRTSHNCATINLPPSTEHTHVPFLQNRSQHGTN